METLSQFDTDLFLFLNGLHTGWMDKDRILAITKCDLVDDDTIKDIKKHLPKKVPHVFISSVAQQGIDELKDLIWLTLNKADEGEDW